MPTLTDRELEELKASVDCCVENGISRVNVHTSDLSKLLASYEERGRALADLLDLPEAKARLAHLDRGIGTKTEQAAWLKARSLSPTSGGGE